MSLLLSEKNIVEKPIVNDSRLLYVSEIGEAKSLSKNMQHYLEMECFFLLLQSPLVQSLPNKKWTVKTP